MSMVYYFKVERYGRIHMYRAYLYTEIYLW